MINGIIFATLPVPIVMYNIRRNWKKYLVIYGAIAVVAYGAIYLLFFSGLVGGGGGSSPYGY